MEVASIGYLPRPRSGAVNILLATDAEVNNCFSIYYNSEIIEHKMMIFNSFTVANDYNFGAR